MPIRDILVISVVLASLPVALMRPWVGILIWSWIGYMNPHKLTWTFAQNFPVAAMVGAVTLVGAVFAPDRRNVPWTREMVILLLLAGYFTLTTITAWYPVESWAEWEKVMKILLFTFLTTMFIYGRQRIHILLMVIILSIGFYGAKGGIFSLVHGGQYMIFGPEGTFIGSNTTLGLAMVMVLPMVLLIAQEESRRWLRRSLYALFWLTVLSVLFTYSRGAFLGLIVIMVPLFWRYKGRIVLVAAVAGVAMIGADLIPEKWYERQETTLEYKQDWSAMQRIQAWSVAWNIARERPYLGAGFNFEYSGDNATWLSYAAFLGEWENKARAAHSIFFQILGQHGFVGLGLFLVLLAGTYFRLRRLARLERGNDPNTIWIGRYARGLQIGLVGYVVCGAFLSLAYFDLFYAVVALSAILQREYEEATAPASARSAVEARRTVPKPA